MKSHMNKRLLPEEEGEGLGSTYNDKDASILFEQNL